MYFATEFFVSCYPVSVIILWPGWILGGLFPQSIFIAPVHFLRNISLCRIASPEGGSNDDDACGDRESLPRIPKYWRVHLLFITGVYSDPSLLIIECIWRVLLLLQWVQGYRIMAILLYKYYKALSRASSSEARICQDRSRIRNQRNMILMR